MPSSNPRISTPAEIGFSRTHDVVDGIERSIVRATRPRHDQTLLFVHGMWHGAWCWEMWQELFALWGWDSVAFSLPGHGRSPQQRTIRWCTLSYYTDFLVRETERLEKPPVLIGHSLGSAMIQRYLKQVGDVPAAVMLAPWLAHSMLGLIGRYFHMDFWGGLTCLATLTTNPVIRSPKHAAQAFLSDDSTISPEELAGKLGPESLLPLFQHMKPFWTPRTDHDTPLLWVSAEQDRLIPLDSSRESAKEFGADFLVHEGAAHDLILESDNALVAAQIDEWLVKTLGFS